MEIISRRERTARGRERDRKVARRKEDNRSKAARRCDTVHGSRRTRRDASVAGDPLLDDGGGHLYLLGGKRGKRVLIKRTLPDYQPYGGYDDRDDEDAAWEQTLCALRELDPLQELLQRFIEMCFVDRVIFKRCHVLQIMLQLEPGKDQADYDDVADQYDMVKVCTMVAVRLSPA